MEESKQFQLNMLGYDIEEVEKALSGVKQPVGVCCIDLQYRKSMTYEETRQFTLVVSYEKDKLF